MYDTTLGALANDPNYALTNVPVWFQIRSSWTIVIIEDDYYKYPGDPNPEVPSFFINLTGDDTPEAMSEHLVSDAGKSVLTMKKSSLSC